jgi:hypothetical protein
MSDFHIKAQLQCGMIVEINQPGDSATLELTFYPPEGKKIEDTAFFKDGNLRINATIPALAGMYQFLGLIFGYRKRKKFLGIF